MNERCTFKQGLFNCGSYAFNLYKEDIKQGDYCDHHYWQDQAIKAAAHERKACLKIISEYQIPVGNSSAGVIACEMTYGALKDIYDDITARGTT
jgi:hypothetical protein